MNVSINYRAIAPVYILLLLLHGSIARAQQKTRSTFNSADDQLTMGQLTAVGFDSTIINKIDTAVANGTFPNIHSVLIAKDNRFVYEKYWKGKDEVWGINAGVKDHGKDSLHDIRSITKSIVSACFGILLQQGKIRSTSQKVFAFFPEYKKQDTGLKSLLTIEHLLTMTSGFKWNEDVPYDNPENSEIQMIKSGHPAEYVLSQPMEQPPGKQWKYNGGTTQLLAAIVEKITGQNIKEFAASNLFLPLGITKFEWIIYPGTKEYAAASGLRLRSRDLLKFGLLYLNNGAWNGKQIVPRRWVDASVQPHIKRDNRGNAYGYQFWLFSDTLQNKPVHVIACVGNGDQRIIINKKIKLVTVVTAGNYNKWNIKNGSYELSKQYIYPALGKNF
ncbi:serine hydrolase domain-containing protein [Longitalea luteola]|uniref:serine hydrolase domain-containing protein n=1 Tax=Longitalea luteola TaxID=2812563 RepID=UPI001A956FEE|nr:serine hydrolase [Longitalea luteola]